MNLLAIIQSNTVKTIQWFLAASLYKKALVVLVVLFLGWLTYSRVFSAKKNTPQFQTAQVEKGTLISSVTASGAISNTGNVTITTSMTGVVNEVYVSDGDAVFAGQEIARITPDQSSQQKQAEAYASYLAAQNSLASAQAKINSLQSTLFKANQAFVTDKGTADPDTDDPVYIQERADWLQAEADYKNQQNVIAQAQASLTSAALSYQQNSSVITAPADGVISNLTLAPGLAITSSSNNSSSSNSSSSTSSTSYGEIKTDQGQTQSTVNLSEIDVTKVKVGQKVTLTMDAFPDKTFTGHVATINTNGSVSSGVTTYPATIVFDAPISTMYPNMAVSAQIITSVKSDVLLVPSSAVAGSGEDATVQIIRNGQPEQISVVAGDSNDTQTEIISGLSEGDTVVSGSLTIQQNTSGRGATGASPFGGGGFGGARTFTGGGGGNRVFIQSR